MQHQEHSFQASAAWMLDNPVRSWLQPAAELVEKIGFNPEDVVVDFGCGPGYYITEIAKRAKTAAAVDISPEMLKKRHSTGRFKCAVSSQQWKRNQAT